MGCGNAACACTAGGCRAPHVGGNIVGIKVVDNDILMLAKRMDDLLARIARLENGVKPEFEKIGRE